MELIDCSKTSVRNDHHSLHSNPDEGSSGLLLGGSPKSRIVQLVYRQDLDQGLPSPFVCCTVFVILPILSLFQGTVFKFNMPQPAFVSMFWYTE